MQAAAGREQAARAVERALSRDPGAQQQREQLLVRQGAGSEAQEPFAGPFVGRQIADAESASR